MFAAQTPVACPYFVVNPLARKVGTRMRAGCRGRTPTASSGNALVGDTALQECSAAEAILGEAFYVTWRATSVVIHAVLPRIPRLRP